MRIHIHSRHGLYTVVSYDEKVINLMTKAYQFTVPVKDFKCFAGGVNNIGVSEEEMNKFYLTIKKEETMSSVHKFLKKLFSPESKPAEQPEMYKKTYYKEQDDLPF